MAPIIAVFMSMMSLLAIIADRASLQEQSLSVQGETIPLPSVDDGVSRNFLDVAKRTLPVRMTPARAITLRRVPRAAPVEHPDDGPLLALAVPERRGARGLVLDDGLLLRSLLIRALQKRDLEDTSSSTTSTSSVAPTVRPVRPAQPTPSTTSTRSPRSRGRGPPGSPSPARPRPGPWPGQHRSNSLAVDVLRGDLAVHGRDREQLRRRWKIEDAKYRVANVRG